MAIVDSHFPWTLSGFRYHEAEEFYRRRPDTLFFSLYQTTDPFPTQVFPLAQFPTVAPAAGVTDIHMVFFNWAAGILGVAGSDEASTIAGARTDISLLPTITRWAMRPHVTIYPGGGLFPQTPRLTIEKLADRCATVSTSVAEVAEILPSAHHTTVPIPIDLYEFRSRQTAARPRIAFVGDDRPRKGLKTLLDAMDIAGHEFELDVVGPHDRYSEHLKRLGAQIHGWLEPEELREVLYQCDFIVAPASTDRPEDGYGDTGVVDGFPTTAARVAMLTGCCMIGSNPTSDRLLLEPGIHYLEFPERDSAALVHILRQASADDELRARVAAAGAERLRARCDVKRVVASKLKHYGLDGPSMT